MLQRVLVPTDVSEAVALLQPEAAFLAGGTLLMPVVNNEVSPWATLVSARRLGLDSVTVEGGVARVGAATTLTALGHDERLAFLHPVVESIASPLIRNLATVGGNLFAWQPYGDLAVALLALDAVAAITGPAGNRQAPVDQVLAAGVGPGEIVTQIAFALPAPGTFFYTKAMRRKLNSAAIVTVAAVITQEGGRVASARLALGGAGPRPIRAPTAEAALIGRPLDAASVTAAAGLALADAAPFSDAYASAWYRARVLPVHIRRAILGSNPGQPACSEGGAVPSTIVTLTVNGQEAEFLAKPGLTLLNALRDNLGLVAAKRGCAQGGCGSCAVILDGQEVPSCLIPVETIIGAEVRTLEGLATGSELTPLQAAFLDGFATQCGFCASGMLMAATALLEETPAPSREDVVRAISGHVCRCTGYEAIINAVLAAAETQQGGEVASAAD